MDHEWPNLFVAGAPRAGTTSLWSYLGQHLDIFMAKLKEPHYFASNTDGIEQFVPVVTDDRAYLKLFAPGRNMRFRGEASPSYLGDPDASARIGRVSRGAKIIISIREPLSRAYSSYWHRVRYGLERRSFLTAVKEGLAPEAARAFYVRRSLYSRDVERYLLTFPGSVHILFFEELAADTRGSVRSIYEFLDIDPGFAERFDPEIRNPTSLPRNALARSIYSSRRLRRIGRALVPQRLHARVESALLEGASPPPIDPEVRELLRERFQADREHLESVLGRTVPWDPL